MKKCCPVLLALVLSTGGRAHAGEPDPNEPPTFRLYMALGGGPMLSQSLSIDGKPAAEPNDQSINAGVAFGLDRRVASWLSLGAEARYLGWSSSWAQRAGYDSGDGGRDRAGLDLDPQLRLLSPLLHSGGLALRFSLAPSAGLTLPTAPTRRTRAVRESWEPRSSRNAGVALEVETWRHLPGTRWKLGVALSVLYTRRWMTLDGTSTPVSDPGAAVSARYRYVTDCLLVRVAALASP